MVATEGHAHASGRLFWGGVKGFADGSLGSCTALMREPYVAGACGSLTRGPEEEDVGEDKDAAAASGGDGAASKGYGLRLIDMARLGDLVEHADKAGLQVRMRKTNAILI